MNSPEKVEWYPRDRRVYLIQTEAGKAAIVAAALPDVPGVVEAASLAGPYNVIARVQAHDIDELARVVASRVQAPGGVMRTMSCPVVHR